MSRGASVIALLGGLLLALPEATAAAAPGEQAAVDKMVSLNTTAITAHQAGDHQAARSRLLEAVVLGKSNGLDKHGIMARTYLHLGVVHIEGLKERDKGLRYMVMALTVRPDIEVTPSLATPAVAREFKQAKADHAAAPPRPAAEDEDPLAEEEPPPAEKKDPQQDKLDKKAAAEAAKEAKAQERAAAASAKEAAAQAAKEARAAEKAAAQAEREAKVLAAAEEKERKKEEKRLALAAAAETKGREKLQKEKDELQAQLAEAREQAQTEKDQRAKVEKEKAELQKELTALRAEQKKEKEARDKLQKEKGDTDRQLAEAREREKKEKEARDRTQKEKADIDRQLAETREREKKEREAREKLDKEKQLAEARERERKEAADREKEARARLAEGPDMPGRIPEPVFCPNPEEAYTGRDLYVHCVPRNGGEARTLALYYRPSGVVHFNSLAMARGKKGWHLAVIPADKVAGRSMQYYVEARGAGSEVVATTGKKSLPNIIPLKPPPPPGTALAEGAPAPAAAPGGKARTARSPARRARPR